MAADRETQATSPSNDSHPRLPRVLGPVGAMAVVVGSVIGSGIFFKAAIIARSLGRLDLILLVWLVCGLLSLLGALALAELGTMLPHAGGQYVFLREAFGPLYGFLWGWVEFWVTRSGAIAALGVAFSMAFYESLGTWLIQQGWVLEVERDGVPFVQLLGDWELSRVWTLRLVAIGTIVILTVLNYVGTVWGGRLQNVTTFVKVGTLMALMVLPFVTGTANSGNLFSVAGNYTTPGLLAGFAAAMTAVFWAYDGWGNLGPVCEEIREPNRNVPLALGGGMLVLIALYLGATVAYHLVLTMDEIAGSKFVAASACAKCLGTYGAAIASAAVMISTLGALNGNILISPRIIFAMARDGAFIPAAARVHPRFRTPHVAIVTMSCWSIVLIAGSDLVRQIPVIERIPLLPKFVSEPLTASLNAMRNKPIYDILTDFVVFGAFVFSLLAVAAVFVLRRRHPEWERPYRTLGYPYLPIIFLLGSAGFLVGMLLTSPVESFLGSSFIAIGWLVYRQAFGRGAPPGSRTLVPMILVVMFLFGANKATRLQASDEAAPARVHREALDRDFAAQLELLAAKCEQLDLKPQAEITRRWLVRRDPRRQYFFLPPKSDETKPTASSPTVVKQWHDRFTKLRVAQAESLFALAKTAVAEKKPAEAYQLLYEVLRENPDHAEARRVLGHVRAGTQWRAEAKIEKPQLARFDHPQLPWKRGQYLRAETDHFRICSNAGEKAVIELSRQLEDLHVVWRQLFFRYWSTAAALGNRLSGGNDSLGNRRQHEVVLFRSREDYVQALVRDQPRIAATMGLYLDRQSTSFFFSGDETVQPTWYHEVTHQLLQESEGVASAVGEKANVWAIEAIAMYFESLRWHEGYVTLGGIDADRLQFVRYRTLRGDTVPGIEQLMGFGRDSLQKNPDIAKIYTQSAGWSAFFMDDQRGRYRDSFIDYLSAIYQGRDTVDSLRQRIDQDVSQLEKQFRQFLNVTDEDMAATVFAPGTRSLVLGGTAVTDRGLGYLPSLAKLELLDLAFTKATDDGLMKIRSSTSLKQLFLERTAISDRSAEWISGLKNLEELDLSSTAITDGTLEKLISLRALKKLYLTNCSVTDQGVLALKALRKLDTLEVTGTQVTPAALQQLRRSLPQLNR